MDPELQRLAASTVYLASSILTTLSNKYILSGLQFQMQYLLVALQSLIIVLLLLGLRALRAADFGLARHRRWMVPSLFLSVMIFSGSKSLYYLPISLYTLFKNTSIVLIALIEHIFFKRRMQTLSFISFVLMILSSYVVDSSDTVPATGYLWIALNILATTVYILSLKTVIDQDSSTRMESVYYSNLISLPVLLSLSLLFDKKDRASLTLEIALWILASALCAFLTCFSTAWTLNVLSSTALSMLGALNKTVGSFGGILFLREPVDRIKVASLSIGAVAAGLYSYDIGRKKT
jgi:GDP-mannose transporter